MRQRHRATIALTATVALLLLAAATTATASDTQVVVSDIELSTDEPETGEPVTVTVTVDNLDDSTTIELTQVEVAGYPVDTRGKARGLGALGPGDSLSIPLTVTFDEPGQKNLRAHVRGVEFEDGLRKGGIHHVRYPFHLTVDEPSSTTAPTPPRLDVRASDASTNQPTTAEVVVSNPDDSGITDLELEVESDTVDVDHETRITPRLRAYNTTRFEFEVTPTSEGEAEITATLTYDGGEVTESQTLQASTTQDENVSATPDDDDGFGLTVLIATLLSSLTAGGLVTRRAGL